MSIYIFLVNIKIKTVIANYSNILFWKIEIKLFKLFQGAKNRFEIHLKRSNKNKVKILKFSDRRIQCGSCFIHRLSRTKWRIILFNL